MGESSEELVFRCYPDPIPTGESAADSPLSLARSGPKVASASTAGGRQMPWSAGSGRFAGDDLGCEPSWHARPVPTPIRMFEAHRRWGSNRRSATQAVNGPRRAHHFAGGGRISGEPPAKISALPGEWKKSLECGVIPVSFLR